MLGIHKYNNGRFIDFDSIENDCWINMISPNYNELSRVSNLFKDIPEEFFTDPLDIDERPRIEIEGNNILIILRVPYFDKDSLKNSYSTIPLGIILLSNNIITISSIKLEILNTFLNRKMKSSYILTKERFFLMILLRVSILYLTYLRQINDYIFLYENRLHGTIKNEELLQLMDIEKSLVYFATSIKANELMISRLSVSKGFISILTTENLDLLEDVIIEYKQNNEMTSILTNILNRIMNTSMTLVSNKLNTTIKTLMIILIIISIISTLVPILNIFIVNKTNIIKYTFNILNFILGGTFVLVISSFIYFFKKIIKY